MFKYLFILSVALLVCLSATADTLAAVTPQGLVFVSERGNERINPLPAGVTIPATAQSLDWAADTLTLTYTTPNEPDALGGPVAATPHTLTLTAAQIATAYAYTPAPRVPSRVTKAQLKLALISAGINLADLVSQLPEESQQVANILIADADYFERTAGMVATLGALAGYTSAQLDGLFTAAAAIDPTQL